MIKAKNASSGTLGDRRLPRLQFLFDCTSLVSLYLCAELGPNVSFNTGKFAWEMLSGTKTRSSPSVRNLSHMLPKIKGKAQFPLPLGCPNSTKGTLWQATVVSRQSLSLSFPPPASTVPCIEPWSDLGRKMALGSFLQVKFTSSNLPWKESKLISKQELTPNQKSTKTCFVEHPNALSRLVLTK